MPETMTQLPDQIEIDLGRLFRSVLRRWPAIVLTGLIFATAAFSLLFFFTSPSYESGVMFYVYNAAAESGEPASISSGDLTTSRKLVESYIVILNTRESLNAVLESSGVNRSFRELEKMISAEAVAETEFFQVTVTADNPAEAERIADAIADILPGRISAIIDGTSVKVADAAVLPEEAASLGYVSTALTCFLLGLLLSTAVVVLRELMNTRIRSEEDIRAVTGLPVLASVPEIKPRDPMRQPVGEDLSFAAAESYRLLRTKLRYSFAGAHSCRIIGLSGALSGEGKTLTAVNLAWTLSRLKHRVLLVECDLRRPTLTEKLPVMKQPGLSGYLSGQRELEDLLQPCGLQGEEGAFLVIPAGELPPDPMELLSSQRMAGLLQQLRSRFDYILLDLPPAGEVSDALELASAADGIVLVVRRGICTRPALAGTIRQLEFVGARLLGLVHNGAEPTAERSGYDGYGWK